MVATWVTREGIQSWVVEKHILLLQGVSSGAGQTVKRRMVTYRIKAFGEDLAGFGQVGKG